MLRHKFLRQFFYGQSQRAKRKRSDFKCYLDEDGIECCWLNGNEKEEKWRRAREASIIKALLGKKKRKIKKMIDSKSIKSNEKTVLGAINDEAKSDFFAFTGCHKEHSCKYCFFPPNWKWQARVNGFHLFFRLRQQSSDDKYFSLSLSSRCLLLHLHSLTLTRSTRQANVAEGRRLALRWILRLN